MKKEFELRQKTHELFLRKMLAPDLIAFFFVMIRFGSLFFKSHLFRFGPLVVKAFLFNSPKSSFVKMNLDSERLFRNSSTIVVSSNHRLLSLSLVLFLLLSDRFKLPQLLRLKCRQAKYL